MTCLVSHNSKLSASNIVLTASGQENCAVIKYLSLKGITGSNI